MTPNEFPNKSPEAYSQRVLEILNDPNVPEREKRILMAVVDNMSAKPKTPRPVIASPNGEAEGENPSAVVAPPIEQALSETRAKLPIQGNGTGILGTADAKETNEYLSGEQVAQAWNNASRQLKEGVYFRDLLIGLLEQMGCKKGDVTSSIRTIMVRTRPSKEELEKKGWAATKVYILPNCSRNPMGMNVATVCYYEGDLQPIRSESQATEFTMEHPAVIFDAGDGTSVTEESLPTIRYSILKGTLRKK